MYRGFGHSLVGQPSLVLVFLPVCQHENVTELSSAAFRGHYQPVKELLNVSDAGIKVSNAASEIPHTTRKAIQLRLYAIEAAFDRCQSLLCQGVFIFIIRLLRRQAANQMMPLRVLPGTSHQLGDALRIA